MQLSTAEQAVLKIFKIVAEVEAYSFLILLFIAMPLKYFAGIPMAVKVVGMAHGVLFVAFMFALIRAAWVLKWSFVTIAQGFISSVLPFGAFWFNRQLSKTYA